MRSQPSAKWCALDTMRQLTSASCIALQHAGIPLGDQTQPLM